MANARLYLSSSHDRSPFQQLRFGSHRFCLSNLQVLIAVFLALLTLSVSTSAQTAKSSSSQSTPQPLAQVAKLLNSKCMACHKQEKSEGAYRMDTMAALMQPGDSGLRPLVAGQPNESELYRRLITTDSDQRMPADSPPLSVDEIELVRNWIASITEMDSSLLSQPLARLAHRSSSPAPNIMLEPYRSLH